MIEELRKLESKKAERADREIYEDFLKNKKILNFIKEILFMKTRKNMKIICLMLAIMMVFTVLPVWAAGESDGLLWGDGNFDVSLRAEEPRFISPADYIERWGGREAVIQGFSEALNESLMTLHLAAMEEAMGDSSSIMSFDAQMQLAETVQAEALTEAFSTFEALETGYWLGMEILGVSDVSPCDPYLEFSLDPPSYFTNRARNWEMISIPDSETAEIGIVPFNANHQSPPSPFVMHQGGWQGQSYRVYYRRNQDVFRPYFRVIEPEHGAFVYKHSWANQGYSRAQIGVSFNNTVIQFANDSGGNYHHNAFAYVAAQQGLRTLDFGLMASRFNRFMFAFHFYTGSTLISFPNFPILHPTSSTWDPQTRAWRSVFTGQFNITLHVTGRYDDNNAWVGRQILRIDRVGALLPSFAQTLDRYPTLRWDLTQTPRNNGYLTFIQAISFIHDRGITARNTGTYFGPVLFARQELHLMSAGGRRGGPAYSVSRRTNFTTTNNAVHGGSGAVRFIFMQNQNNLRYNFRTATETVTITYPR